MSANFQTCLNWTLLPGNDGQGLHVTPGDAGAATNMGIDLETYRDYMQNPSLTADDLGKITSATISAIYGVWFWNPINGDRLPIAVALMVFDQGVVTGPENSAKVLQRVLGMTGDAVDGWIGDATIAAAKNKAAVTLIGLLATAQIAYYKACKDFDKFGHGWTLRVERREAYAAHLIGATSLQPLSPLPIASPHSTSRPVQLAAPPMSEAELYAKYDSSVTGVAT